MADKTNIPLIYERVQKKYSLLEDQTPENIQNFLSKDGRGDITIGIIALAEELSAPSNISREIREADTVEDIDKIIIPDIEIPKQEIKLKQRLGARRKVIRRTTSLKDDLFENPDIVRIQGRRTWSSVQRYFNLSDEELQDFKQENPNIELR